MKTATRGRTVVMGIVIMAASAGVSLADRYVATNGASTSPYDTWAKAATNIQTAINEASAGETVWVSNGVYLVSSAVLISANITLRGFNGRDVTVIDGGNAHRCVYASSTPNCTVAGFTIRNGLGETTGGGVYINAARATITNCIITANKSTGGGGGVYAYQGTGYLYNCVISCNTNLGVSDGGGVSLKYGGILSNCWIIGNTSGYGGGAAIGEITMDTNSTVASCVITGNLCGTTGGAGLLIYGSRVVNSIIAWNTSAGKVGGISSAAQGAYIGNCVINSNEGTFGVAVSLLATNATVENCEIRGNTSTGGGSSYGSIVLFNDYDVLRGCLIADNVTTNYGIVYSLASHGNNLVQNCTIVNNRNLNPLTSCAGFLARNTDRMENTICYSNMDATTSNDRNWYTGLSPTITYSCTWPDASARGAGNTTNNPVLADIPGGNYRPQRPSPCINTGSNQNWMATAVDRDGRRRLDYFQRLVDMGAYEFIPAGTVFTFR